MKQKGDIILIFPGEEFWQFGKAEAGSVEWLSSEKKTSELHDFSPIPQGELALAFPINQLTFAPFIADTTDENLYQDLVQSHLESLSLRANEQGGVLVDYQALPIGQVRTVLVPYMLAEQKEETLPVRPPHFFDISAHFFGETKNSTLRYWKELGHWVFALFEQGVLVYAQVLGSELTSEAIKESQLALIQLVLQGVMSSSEVEIFVYHSNIASIDRDLIEKELGSNVQILERPKPILPKIWSRLLPADVGSEIRRRVRRKRNLVIAGACGVLLLLAAGWQYREIQASQAQIDQLQKAVIQNRPAVEALEKMRAQHVALGPVVNSEYWPESLLLRITRCLPTDGTVRFTLFEMSPDANGVLESVVIRGESLSNEKITSFQQKLKSTVNDVRWTTGMLKSESNGKFTFEMTATRNAQ